MAVEERTLGAEIDLESQERFYDKDLESSGELYLDTFFKPARGGAGGDPSPINYTPRAQKSALDDTDVPPVTRAPRKRHETRSRHARVADESFNAPLAPTYSKWLQQPNRYDFPMVDTIPPERIQQRADDYASEALEGDVIESVKDDPQVTEAGVYGRFRWSRGAVSGDAMNPRVRMDPEKPKADAPSVSESYGYTLAHEVGHAIDFRRARAKGLDLDYAKYYSEFEAGKKDIKKAKTMSAAGKTGRASKSMPADVLGELERMSERGRGVGHSDYRRSIREVTADALALRRLEPRATKREFPKANEWLGNLEREAFEWSGEFWDKID